MRFGAVSWGGVPASLTPGEKSVLESEGSNMSSQNSPVAVPRHMPLESELVDS